MILDSREYRDDGQPTRVSSDDSLVKLVRELLLDVLRGEKDLLFPEIGAIRDDLGSLAGEVSILREERDGETEQESATRALALQLAQRLEFVKKQSLESKREIETRVDAIREEMSSWRSDVHDLVERLRDRIQSLESAMNARVEGLSARVEADLGYADARLRESIKRVGNGVLKAMGSRLSEVVRQLRVLESRVAEGEERIDQRMDEESRRLQETVETVRSEIMDKVESKLDELMGLVSKFPELVPPRDSVERLEERIEERLGRMESEFERVATRLTAISSGEAMDSARERIDLIRTQIRELVGAIERRGTAIHGAQSDFLEGLEQLRELFRSGLEQREMKRGIVRKRMLDLRDALRENLGVAAQNAVALRSQRFGGVLPIPGASKGVSAKEVERFRDVLQEVLEAVEFLIFETGRNGIS